mmetsp:Transcript_158859/g.505827  ORF Transcript_158859/g.505827 Transcript_158859/m.505827 type:complete len:215 (+) Transcript_158859:642-1286(+)
MLHTCCWTLGRKCTSQPPLRRAAEAMCRGACKCWGSNCRPAPRRRGSPARSKTLSEPNCSRSTRGIAGDGTYIVTVLREGCTAARPLFDPVSRSCVVNCGAGFYENSESSRCSRCNANCAVCAGLLRCELCRQDTPHLSYIIQQDGSCLGVQSTLLGKYYWWCISLGIFAAGLLCMLIGVLCQFICTCCCCPERDRYGFDTDSEAEIESERLLG